MTEMTDTLELACSIAELFEDLLEEKKMVIPCSDPTEEKERHYGGNSAALYGMEFWSLVDSIEEKLLNGKDIPVEIVKTIRGKNRYDTTVRIWDALVENYNMNERPICILIKKKEVEK